MFAIGVTSPITFSFRHYPWATDFWRVEICLCKPKVYSYIPFRAENAYEREFGVDLNFLDDPEIPF